MSAKDDSAGQTDPSGPRWLDREEMLVWRNFMHSGVLLNRRIDQQLKESSGLSHVQYVVLMYLADEPTGELRMTQLAGILNTSKSGLTYQVGQLEEAGYLRRSRDPDDVRGVIACLTEAGRQRQAQAAVGHVALVRELFIDVLTRQQRAAIMEGLGRVRRRLRREEASHAGHQHR